MTGQTMKRIAATILILVSAALACAAQGHLSERVYISTDRDVYVSGDEVFLSAFCLDMATGRLSGFSKTAYVEIASPSGPVQTAKLALVDGRGGGVIHLQNTIPTGNYRLVAYTAQCFNEDGYDFGENARTLSIINPFTTDRSDSGVEILSDEDYAGLEAPERPSAGSLRVSASGGRLTVTNTSSVPVSVSVSIFHDDGIVSPSGATPATFLAGATRGNSFTDRRVTDYEGEVIRVRVQDATDEELALLKGSTVFFSVPGRASDFYAAPVGEDGTASFYTRNVYGDTDAVLELGDGYGSSHLEIIPPFAGVHASGLEKLPLSEGLRDRILSRSLSMQFRQASRSDTLYARIETPRDLLFDADTVEYKLDDYTRFPLMEELFIEFISEIRTRRINRMRTVAVNVNDTFKPASDAQFPALVLLDGVPLVEHERIYEYDPLLVERVVIYPHSANVGFRTYSGIVNFVTYKHNLPSYSFGNNTRVVDFQGESYPVVSYMPDTVSGVADLRQTVLWHPMVDLAPGESRVIDYCLPSYQGLFKAVVEGFDADGNPQYLRTDLP